MNKHKTNPLIEMQLCSIVLLTLVVGASANAQTSSTASVTPPPVPTDVHVPAGNKVFLVGHAVGTQNYVCLPSGSGVAYTLFTPQATLFNDQGEQIITHFFSPNPSESGIVRPTWEHSKDTSTVWGRGIGSSSDPKYVTPGAIPWLLIQVKDVGAIAGPTGGDKLTRTTFIQRLNTVGGVAPSTGCTTLTDIGNKAFVPYTADYFFYKDASHQGRDDNQ